MLNFLKDIVVRRLRAQGYALVHERKPARDMEEPFREIVGACQPFTMVSVDGLYTLYKAVERVVERGVPGALVECGVWRGGSAMLMARALQRFGATDRDLFLFDTFEGMSEPTDRDRKVSGGDTAVAAWKEKRRDGHVEWSFAPLDDVARNVRSTGFPEKRLRFVKGKVEDTIPASAPERIAVLRLDTDWYESTKHELTHLFPRVSPGGIVIVDDYGSWAGAREATDEYAKANPAFPHLVRVNNCIRMGVVA